jgi:hypothetical protein
MRTRRLLSISLALVVLSAGTSAAQDGGKTGVTMGYPASIGLVWHANKNVAIRPELSLSGSSSSANGSTGSPGITTSIEGDGLALGTGVSVLFYLHTYDHLRTYFSPRFTYAHTRSTTTSSTSVGSFETKTTSYSLTGNGSFGAEYALSDKFSAFGEVGFGFGHSKNSSSSSSIKPTANNWGTRTGVGVIYYF